MSEPAAKGGAGVPDGAPATRRRRIWVEMVPYATLREARVTALLKRFGLGALVAVRPPTLVELPPTLDVLLGEGIEVGVWPMLDDREGRWANVRNAAAFATFAREVAASVGERPIAELTVDLEPAIDDMRAALVSLRGAGRMIQEASDKARFDAARATYEGLVRALAERGIATSAVAVPMVLLDRPPDAPHWQGLLGTPLDGPAWSAVNVMLYTSMVEGWSHGLLDRARAESVLASACRATAARYGEKGCLSLGVVGTGALGDEPVYRSPTELARDVAVARACNVDDLVLFDLGGVLARAPAEAWLDAFTSTEPTRDMPPDSLRGRSAFSVASVTAASIGVLAPLLRRAGLVG
jgi:hypothetical protein